MALLYRPLAEMLRQAGCRFERQGKGSHEIWYSPITQRTFTVPANIDGKPLAVMSQQVVHSAPTEDAEVAEALANLGGTEWTCTRMPG